MVRDYVWEFIQQFPDVASENADSMVMIVSVHDRFVRTTPDGDEVEQLIKGDLRAPDKLLSLLVLHRKSHKFGSAAVIHIPRRCVTKYFPPGEYVVTTNASVFDSMAVTKSSAVTPISSMVCAPIVFDEPWFIFNGSNNSNTQLMVTRNE